MELRERRRLETTHLIQRAALQLARTEPVESISVEMICKEAGISPRTFFNYFPYKEAVFVVPPPPFPEDALKAFYSGRGTLLDQLIDLLAAQSLSITPDRWMIETAQKIASNHPKIAALQFAQFRDFETTIANLIARRLGRDENDQASRLIAAALLGAMRIILDGKMPNSAEEMAEAIRADLQHLATFVIEPPHVPDMDS